MCAKITKEESGTEEFDRFVDNLDKILEEQDAQDYTPEVVREFRNPSNIGRLPGSNGEGISDGICGDSMEMYVRVENEVVQQCNFFTDGCGASIACGSMLTKMVKGLTLDDAMKIPPEKLDSILGGLPADHKHCAALSVLAFRNALRNYLKNLENESKNNKVRK